MVGNCALDSKDQSKHRVQTPPSAANISLGNMSTSQSQDPPVAEVLAHVVDVHCHPTDSVMETSSMDSLPIRICAMFVPI